MKKVSRAATTSGPRQNFVHGFADLFPTPCIHQDGFTTASPSPKLTFHPRGCPRTLILRAGAAAPRNPPLPLRALRTPVSSSSPTRRGIQRKGRRQTAPPKPIPMTSPRARRKAPPNNLRTRPRNQMCAPSLAAHHGPGSCLSTCFQNIARSRSGRSQSTQW
ncbi:hypothetical protein MPH_06289 [Macrophomina phaseolina MS6]|uniref:Uncharacterized protein n=1 Tax=Macrophomina phaseolina (strain MS6) TaxID=1126212 RepID=K2RP53_MACPH|nr:hypothetical protein MPH_06289 [Macrophomina phaseolina MS6]